MTEKTAIIVVGMHRSGTSAIARTFSLLGAALPTDLVGPNEGNPFGHWEPQSIVELNDRILADAGSDVYSAIDARPDWLESPRIAGFVSEGARLLRASFNDDSLIVVKDPRVALLLPIWKKAFAEAGYRCAYVLPLRHPDSVAESLQRRHIRSIPYNAWMQPRGQMVWLRYTIASVIGTRSTIRCFLNYADLLRDWRAATAGIAREFNFKWPRMGPAAEGEIDAFLHRNELADKQAASEMSDQQSLDDLSLVGLSHALYSSLVREGDKEAFTDAVAQNFKQRTQATSDLISAYEALFPLVWEYYQTSLAEKRKNESAKQRFEGMADAIQQLWSDLTHVTVENSKVKQDLGSTISRAASLEAALDHLGKVLTQSNEHRDSYFKSLGDALRREKVAQDETDALRTQLAALQNLNNALLTSSSWRLTAPVRAMAKFFKVR
ncbi:hypothetical protein [Bradyrhizobium liaoningense]|uniref:hypothetical protein n=1 Tax=Bradyrhizobium liaoningense TaxID=43992 RepID=UPI001BA83034|nr:hypothetical protein [Bradyrhizobium liaoningense]MBR0904569.1 hypothetical protein [Bradyrhizobium liaoningense]